MSVRTQLRGHETVGESPVVVTWNHKTQPSRSRIRLDVSVSFARLSSSASKAARRSGLPLTARILACLRREVCALCPRGGSRHVASYSRDFGLSTPAQPPLAPRGRHSSPSFSSFAVPAIVCVSSVVATRYYVDVTSHYCYRFHYCDTRRCRFEAIPNSICEFAKRGFADRLYVK